MRASHRPGRDLGARDVGRAAKGRLWLAEARQRLCFVLFCGRAWGGDMAGWPAVPASGADKSGGGVAWRGLLAIRKSVILFSFLVAVLGLVGFG